MAFNSKHIKLTTILFLSILFFSSCKKQETGQFDLIKVKKEIKKKPSYKRIAAWDSLLRLHRNDTLTPYLYYQRGYSYFFLNQNDQAIEDFTKSINLLKKSNNKEMLAANYIYLGASFSERKEQKIATKYIIKGLKLATEINDQNLMGGGYRELAHIYYLNEDYDKTIEYLKKVADIAKKNKNLADVIVSYNNIAIVYKDQGNDSMALNYYHKISELNPEKVMEPYNLIIFYNNFGENIYNTSKDKSKALEYFNKSLNVALKNKIRPDAIYSYFASLYEKTNQIDSAKYYYKKSLETVDSTNYENQLYLHNKLIEMDLKQQHNIKLLKSVKTRDSIETLYIKKFTSDNQLDLENNLKILTQQQELEQAKKINKKNKIIFIFIIIMFVLGLIISFQFNRFDILKHKQELFKLEQKILRSQMNPHFIFNVLGAIQSTLLENNPIASATYLSRFAKLIRQNFDFIQRKQISLKEELDMIHNYLDTQKFRFKEKFDYIINVDKHLSPQEIMVPPMILQPFVENSIEHGFADISYKGHIHINISKKDDKVCFEIIDNGSGYNPKKDDKEHALDIFKKRLFLMGKETFDSYKISRLKQGTKVVFCFDLTTA